MATIRCTFILLASFGFFFFPFVVNSYADTHTAASCSFADVSAAITAASAGDTVNVPAGSCTWGSTLNITKGINLIGPGTNNIKITYSGSGFIFTYKPSNRLLNTPFRLSGFKMVASGSCEIFELGSTNYQPSASSDKQTNIRIDNNYFDNGGGSRYWFIHGGMFGVIDNNTFTGGWYGGRFDVDYGCYAWKYWGTYPGMSAQKALGHGDNIYFEDNHISLTDFGNQTLITSTQFGGRWAFRYNTITSAGEPQPLFDFHGNQNPTSQMASSQLAELYGNNIAISGTSTGRFTDFRGGKSYAFYNNITGANLTLNAREECQDANQTGANCTATNQITGEPQHVSDSHYFMNKNPSGTMRAQTSSGGSICGSYSYSGSVPQHNVDYWNDAYISGGGAGNGTTGIGCGTLASRPATCTTGVAYWATNQSCSDLTGLVGVNPSTPISGTLYKCTATNTWTEYYTPFTYPHPLRGETGGIAAPKGVRLVN